MSPPLPPPPKIVIVHLQLTPLSPTSILVHSKNVIFMWVIIPDFRESRWKFRAKVGKLVIFPGTTGSIFQFCPRKLEPSSLYISVLNQSSLYESFHNLFTTPQFLSTAMPSPPNCAETKYGCCWDKSTAKIDEKGSNCKGIIITNGPTGDPALYFYNHCEKLKIQGLTKVFQSLVPVDHQTVENSNWPIIKRRQNFLSQLKVLTLSSASGPSSVSYLLLLE